MPKFKYKFDTVKKVKAAFEKKAQKELQIIELEIKRTTGLINMYKEEIEFHKSAVTSKKNLKISELKFLTDYENYIIEKINIAKAQLMNCLKDLKNRKFSRSLKTSILRILNFI